MRYIFFPFLVVGVLIVRIIRGGRRWSWRDEIRGCFPASLLIGACLLALWGCSGPVSLSKSPLGEALKHTLARADEAIVKGDDEDALMHIRDAEAALGPAATPAPKSDAELKKELEEAAIKDAEGEFVKPGVPDKPSFWSTFKSYSQIAIIAFTLCLSVVGGIYGTYQWGKTVGAAIAGAFALVAVGEIFLFYWLYMVIGVAVLAVVMGVLFVLKVVSFAKVQTAIVTAVQKGRGALADAGGKALAVFDATTSEAMTDKAAKAVEKVKKDEAIPSVTDNRIVEVPEDDSGTRPD